jgi:hypothetical protein
MVSVITWSSILFVLYFGAIIVGIVLSFTTRKQPRRRDIRIVTVVLTVPIWIILILGIVFWFSFGKEPPTLADLRHDFPSKHADLELILRMSDEDAKFSRIAPDFLDRTTDNPNESGGRYMLGDPKAELSKGRWDMYRKIYSRDGIKLGVQRNASGDAFIMVDSVGLLNRGHASGYLYCAPTAPADAYRFHACMQNQEKGEQKFNPDTGEEGYSFQRLDDRWYAYDEGPS